MKPRAAKSKSKLSIKAWAEADRPREKLMQQGRESLTDAELTGILLGSGNSEESAVGLAKRILSSAGNDLHALGNMSIQELMQFKGIGQAKAITIAAALELGRRRRLAGPGEVQHIGSSNDAYELLYSKLADLNHEQFFVILLNRGNRVIKCIQVSKGGVAGTVADPKLIFKPAIEALASGLILAHNHPSGNLKPSTADIKLTEQLVAAGKMLEITVLDHLIIAGNDYYSFADQAML